MIFAADSTLKLPGVLAEKLLPGDRLQVVFLQTSRSHEKLVLRPAQPLMAKLFIEKRERAEHVGGLEQAVFRRRYLPDVGFQERVEEGVHQVGDLFLAVVVVDDDLVEPLQESQVIPQEHAHVAGYSGNHLVVVCELALPENEGLVRDVAQAHEVEKRAEQLAPRSQIHARVVLLAPDERRRVYCVGFRKALLDEMPLQVLDLIGDVEPLLVEEQRDDVVRGMALVGAEVSRFVDEHAQLAHRTFPRKEKWRGKSPRPWVDQGLSASPE